jgi:hypothetical protein
MHEYAGFETSLLQLDTPIEEQKADLLLLGSYISTHENIVRYLEENRQSIQEFVENGGVVVQFVESPPFDHFYNSSLPEKATDEIILPPHLKAKRTRETFWDLHVRTPEHPVLKGMQIDGSQQGSPTLSEQFGHNATWMAFGERKGFNVLISNTEDDSRTALIEGIHGKGRYIFSSIFFDRLFDEDGEQVRVGRAPPLAQVLGVLFVSVEARQVRVLDLAVVHEQPRLQRRLQPHRPSFRFRPPQRRRPSAAPRSTSGPPSISPAVSMR